MDEILPICIGIGLSASCGFRVLVPFLAMSILALSGHITLSPDMAWIGSYEALGAFSVAVLLEILVYLIPGLDQLMDAIAVPAAAIGGTMITAAFIPETSPMLRWSLAAISGGTVAGSVGSLTSLTRFASTTTTGGVANPVVSVTELVSSIVLTILALMIPFLAAIVVLILLFLAVRKIFKVWTKKRQRATE